jgi:probable HAF family extracellular repeat protein
MSSTTFDEAFLWTPNSGMVGLGDLPGGEFGSGAGAVSRDGTFVVGGSWSESGHEAFRWDASRGLIGLGDLPGGDFFSQPDQISADGSVVVGASVSAESLGQLTAFRWTEAEGMVSLGTLPGGGLTGEAVDVSADGSVIVGLALGVSGFEAFIWDQVHGMQSIQELLTNDYGLDLEGGQLITATALSDDANTIVGWGYNPSGQSEAWLVSFVPEPGTTALLVAGLLSLGRRHRLHEAGA